MVERFVANASELKEGFRRIVSEGKHEIGVFYDKGKLYAYSNFCLHQGGPACEGLIIAQVEEKLMEDMTSVGLRFNHEKLHFVCPWHGWEYDLKTGECAADRRKKLRKYQILRKGEDIYVVF
jgi:nitrite reductase/ring-hydroxylating ferredoxin subunit